MSQPLKPQPATRIDRNTGREVPNIQGLRDEVLAQLRPCREDIRLLTDRIECLESRAKWLLLSIAAWILLFVLHVVVSRS